MSPTDLSWNQILSDMRSIYKLKELVPVRPRLHIYWPNEQRKARSKEADGERPGDLDFAEWHPEKRLGTTKKTIELEGNQAPLMI